MSELQLELETVIDHKHDRVDTYKAIGTERHAGLCLAKLLRQYDDSPSSQLWSGIQALAREILK